MYRRSAFAEELVCSDRLALSLPAIHLIAKQRASQLITLNREGGNRVVRWRQSSRAAVGATRFRA